MRLYWVGLHDEESYMTNRLLTILILVLAATGGSWFMQGAAQAAEDTEVPRWEQETRDTTIIRDDWGIAHIFGKTDADAVFGMVYAQAEDDFNRIETNYINALG